MLVALLVALAGCAVGTDAAPQALREGISSDRALQEVSSELWLFIWGAYRIYWSFASNFFVNLSLVAKMYIDS